MSPLPGFMYAVLVDLPAEQQYTPNTPNHRGLELARLQSGVFPAIRARYQKPFCSKQPPLPSQLPTATELVPHRSFLTINAIRHQRIQPQFSSH